MISTRHVPFDATSASCKRRVVATNGHRIRGGWWRLLPLAAATLALVACRRAERAAADAAPANPAPIGAVRATNSAGRTGGYLLVASSPEDPRPLMVFLHGTGGTGAGGVAMLRPIAERRLFPGGHDLSSTELEAVVDWWLGP